MPANRKNHYKKPTPLFLGLASALVSIYAGSAAQLNKAIFAFAANGEAIYQHHQYYRLLTNNFLHFSPFHLFSNLALMYVVINDWKQVKARHQAFVLLLSGVIASAIASFIHFDHYSAGASGAVMGALGAVYVSLYKERRSKNSKKANHPLYFLLALVVLSPLCDYIFIQVTGIQLGIVAHLVGLIVGSALSFFIPIRSTNQTAPQITGERIQ